MPTSGESSSLAIHVGTSRGSGESAGLDGIGTARGLSLPGSVPFPATISVLFPEAIDAGFVVGVTEVNELLPGDGPCLERGDSLTLAWDSRLDTLLDEACPQPASPATNIRPRRSAKRDCDGHMFSGLSGEAGDGISGMVHRVLIIDH